MSDVMCVSGVDLLADYLEDALPPDVSASLEREDAWYVVQVETRYPAGYVAVDRVADEIRAELVRRKRLEQTRELAPEVATVIRQEGLEAAAERFGLELQTTDWFTRVNNIPGIGSGSPVAGAALGLACE